MSDERFCTACGATLRATAKFCHRCGQPTDGSARAAVGGLAAPASGGGPRDQILPWAVAGIALLCLLAFIVGQNLGRPAARAATAAPPTDATGAGGARAVDISQMSPEERADRLFQRVMTYVSEGKSDSVAFFAPMAIQSQLALSPLDAHRRYDLGLLGIVSGDGAMARAQADTILSAQPDHLLGLILAMRAAGLAQDVAARAKHAQRFVEVVDRERARGLPEYRDHDPDITSALGEASGRITAPPSRQQ